MSASSISIWFVGNASLAIFTVNVNWHVLNSIIYFSNNIVCQCISRISVSAFVSILCLFFECFVYIWCVCVWSLTFNVCGTECALYGADRTFFNHRKLNCLSIQRVEISFSSFSFYFFHHFCLKFKWIFKSNGNIILGILITDGSILLLTIPSLSTSSTSKHFHFAFNDKHSIRKMSFPMNICINGIECQTKWWMKRSKSKYLIPRRWIQNDTWNFGIEMKWIFIQQWW